MKLLINFATRCLGIKHIESKKLLTFDADCTIFAVETSNMIFKDILEKHGLQQDWVWVASNIFRDDYDIDFFRNLIKRQVISESSDSLEEFGVESIYGLETIEEMIELETDENRVSKLNNLKAKMDVFSQKVLDSGQLNWKLLSHENRFAYFFLPNPIGYGGRNGFNDLWPEGVDRENIFEHPAFSDTPKESREFIQGMWTRLIPFEMFKRGMDPKNPTRGFPIQISGRLISDILEQLNQELENREIAELTADEVSMIVAQIYEDALHYGSIHFFKHLKEKFGDQVCIAINSKGMLPHLVGIMQRMEMLDYVDFVAAESYSNNSDGKTVFSKDEALQYSEENSKHCTIYNGIKKDKVIDLLRMWLAGKTDGGVHFGDSSGDLPAFKSLLKHYKDRAYAVVISVVDALYENVGYHEHRLSEYAPHHSSREHKTSLPPQDQHKTFINGSYRDLNDGFPKGMNRVDTKNSQFLEFKPGSIEKIVRRMADQINEIRNKPGQHIKVIDKNDLKMVDSLKEMFQALGLVNIQERNIPRVERFVRSVINR